MSNPLPPEVPQTLPLPEEADAPAVTADDAPPTVAGDVRLLAARKVAEAPATVPPPQPSVNGGDTLTEPPRPAPRPLQPGPTADEHTLAASASAAAVRAADGPATEHLDPVGQEGDTQDAAIPRELRASAQYGATLATVPPTNPGLPGVAPETIGRTLAGPDSPFETAGTEPLVLGYEVLGELGRGGMGVVYKARQVGLNRLVAIKMILAGGHAGRSELARFKAEAEAVARLQHPNIVQIHDIGTQDGKPYFSLEFCEGGSLADKLRGGPLPPQQAAVLVEILAQAMHCAHLQGIVHRDLKPANVLLGPAPGSSSGSLAALPFGTPKITDFGLAKDIREQSGQTQSGAIMGTPNYMAPEQAQGKVKEIGPAADTYALGAILYECLTGRPPFKGDTPWDTVNQVISDDPLPPGRLRRRLPRDLETICLKCLRKDPRRRYASAETLAEDLRRFVEGKTILARPSGTWEWMFKWARRQPAVAALLFLLAALIVGGLFGMSILYARAESQRKDAVNAKLAEEQEKRKADEARQEAERKEEWSRRVSYAAQVNLAQTALQNAHVDFAVGLLGGLKPQSGQKDLRGFEWFYLSAVSDSGLTLKGHTNLVNRVVFSPDGKRMVSASLDGTVKVWDPKTGDKILDLAGHKAPVRTAAYSPDGKWLASGGEDNVVRIWDAVSGKERGVLRGHSGWVTGVAFGPDGKRLASCAEDRTVRLWNLTADGRSAGEPLVLKGHTAGVLCVAFGPEGRRVASGGWDRTVRLWDADSGKALHKLEGHNHWVSAVAFDPFGKRLASAGWDKTVRVWNVEDGTPARPALTGYESPVLSLTFSPDGQRLATLSDDQTPKVWDLTTGTEAAAGAASADPVRGIGFSPDGQLLISVRFDYSRRFLDAGTVEILEGHASAVHAVAFLSGGKESELASAGADRVVRIWRLGKNGQAEERLTLKGAEGPVRCVASSPNGKFIAGGGEDGKVHIWDTVKGKLRGTLKGHNGWVRGVAFSADGKMLASAGMDGTVRLWDLAPLRQGGSVETTALFILEGHSGPVFAVAFRPDGKRLASAGGDGSVRLWDPASGRVSRTLHGDKGQQFRAVAFGPDGRLAAGSWDGKVWLWDAAGKGNLRPLEGHTYGVDGVSFSPDGKRLATASEDRTVKLWDLSTGKELLTLRGPDTGVTGVAFSPDGNHLASSSWDQRVRVWHAPRKK